MLPIILMGGFDQQQVQDDIQVTPEPVVQMFPDSVLTPVPASSAEGDREMAAESENSCDESYPDVCITPYPPDLNCGEIGYSNFRVIGDDLHGFDRDNDGLGCES